MSRNVVQPTVTQDNDEEYAEHPAFGMIGVSRVSTSGAVLHGSAVQHECVIELTIKQGSVRRYDGSEAYFGKRRLIRVAMTPAQFTELITTHSVGDGVPCTIELFDGKVVPGLPARDLRNEFHQDFDKVAARLADDMRVLSTEINRIFAQPTIKKADRQTVAAKLAGISKLVDDNMPWLIDRFNVAMAGVVNDARRAVDVFVEDRRNTLTALYGQQNLPQVRLTDEGTHENGTDIDPGRDNASPGANSPRVR